MDAEHPIQPTPPNRRPLGAVPFLVVACCFLLPFFTASSCGSGRHTTATGVDIVFGKSLIAEQTQAPLFGAGPATALGPHGEDREAQAVSRAARPSATIAFALALIGAVLMFRLTRYRRVAGAAIAAAIVPALVVVVGTFHAPEQDITPNEGIIFAVLIAAGTAIWHVCLAVTHGWCAKRSPPDGPADALRSTATPAV